MRNLPIGIQSFSDIRNNYIYVDKTIYIYDVVMSGKVYFLSRPKRFGKSLLIDTLKCLLESKKELFENLWIYDKWDWDKKYPVVKFDMGSFIGFEFSKGEKNIVYAEWEKTAVSEPKVS
ncbi:MAG TPA: AAA family ATPase [Nitrospirae bacterium]|nr:AAA family ATPase [Nitrospirota bacterium]